MQVVFGKHEFISSSQRRGKTLSHEIQFPPLARLSTASDKCEFDMTLSKSDVRKMQHICVCARACVCVSIRSTAKVSRDTYTTDQNGSGLVSQVDKKSKIGEHKRRIGGKNSPYHKLLAQRTQEEISRGGGERRMLHGAFILTERTLNVFNIT